jgi:hypothetical protein
MKSNKLYVFTRDFILVSVIAVMLFYLSGCAYSPITATYSYINVSAKDQSETTINKTGVLLCPVFKLKDTELPPVAPVDQLIELKENQYKQKTDMLLNYIRTLREYIRDSRIASEKEYNKYLNTCIVNK